MCTPALELNFSDSTAFNSWRQTQAGLIDTLSAVPIPSAKESAQLTQLTQNLNAAYTCVNSKLQQVTNVQTGNANLESRIASLDRSIEERKKDVGVAKDRASLAREPGQSRSYYDGWFPIQRPLKHFTVPVLIGISLFFLMLAFFYFMSLLGIDTRISMRIPVTTGYAAPTQFTGAFWGVSAVAAVLLGLAIYFGVKSRA